jgi:pimeloyl-ACP methyl ester carboxylesterase
MADQWVVLGGWGVAPDVLRPLFGEKSTYVDINRLLPLVVRDNRLHPDWREQCAKQIVNGTGRGMNLAGWSTGAIIALGCCEIIHPASLVLISATRSFCRSSVQRYGMSVRILDAMRLKLAADAAGVVNDFRSRCGFTKENSGDTGEIPWSGEELDAGLAALAELTIDTAAPALTPPLFIHGRNDTIIPIAAGEAACAAAGGTFIAVDAPHACFVNHEQQLRKSIEHYLEGTAP